MSLASAVLVLAVSAAPIAELRGGLPLAISLGYPPGGAYVLAVLGNLLVVPVVLFGLEWAEALLLRWRGSRVLLEWLFARVRRKGRFVERLGPVALVLLVAIPFPGTGAWTGALVARLLGIPARRAMPWIVAGVLIAGGIVLLVSLGIVKGLAVR